MIKNNVALDSSNFDLRQPKGPSRPLCAIMTMLLVIGCKISSNLSHIPLDLLDGVFEY